MAIGKPVGWLNFPAQWPADELACRSEAAERLRSLGLSTTPRCFAARSKKRRRKRLDDGDGPPDDDEDDDEDDEDDEDDYDDDDDDNDGDGEWD